jgi:hypothetical protein
LPLDPDDGDHLQRMVVIQLWMVFILCTAGLAMVIILQRMVVIQSWRVFILCTAGLAVVIISRGWW